MKILHIMMNPKYNWLNAIIIILFISNAYLIKSNSYLKNQFNTQLNSEVGRSIELELLMGMLPDLSKGMSKTEMIDLAISKSLTARNLIEGKEALPAFEKNGCVLVDGVFFRFNEEQILDEVTSSPC